MDVAAAARLAEKPWTTVVMDVTEMPMILLVGTDFPLLEGIAQTLAAVGHRPVLAHTVAEALRLPSGERALVAVVDRALALASSEVQRLPLAPGGALLLYHSAGAAASIPPALQRHVLADLTLPLERQRLVALVQSVRDRAQVTGRGRTDTPEERRRV